MGTITQTRQIQEFSFLSIRQRLISSPVKFHYAILHRSKVLVIFTNWFAGWICTNRAIHLVSAITLYGDTHFWTLWPIPKRLHAALPHTYRRSQSRGKNDPHYGKSTVFTLKWEVRHIYLKFTIVFSWNFKDNFVTGTQTQTTEMTINTSSCTYVFHKELMGHIMRKPVFVICEQQRRRSACTSTQTG